MKMKKVLSILIVTACLGATLPVLGVSTDSPSYVEAGTGALMYDIDFTTKSVNEKPANIFTSNVPTYGDVRYGYKEDGESMTLIIEDTEATSKGVGAGITFPEISGKFTIYSRFTLGKATAQFNFSNNDGITLRVYKGTANFYLYDHTGKQIKPFPKLSYGTAEEMEMWACMDTNKKTADIYIKADVIDRYRGQIVAGGTQVNGVFCLHDFPIKADHINAVGLSTTARVGVNYLDCIRVYDGYVAPVEYQEYNVEQKVTEEAVTVPDKNSVIMSAKDVWITRLQTQEYLLEGLKKFLLSNE